MIHRWTFPLVPDMFTFEKETYQYLRGNVYKQPPVTLSRFVFLSLDYLFLSNWFKSANKNVMLNVLLLNRSSVIEDDSVIGGGTKVGESSTIQRSVVGHNCHIGNGVKIEDSYIWDGCIIKVSYCSLTCKTK